LDLITRGRDNYPDTGGKAVWSNSASDVWVSGNAKLGPIIYWPPRLLRWNGTAWTWWPWGKHTTDCLPGCGLWGSSGSDVWFVGGVGSVDHWNGSVWTKTYQDSKFSWHGVWGASSSDIWAVGERWEYGTFASGIAHWNGTDWSATKTVLGYWKGKLRGVWGSSASDVWAVGDDGNILHYACRACP
jgi:hypothetical protein